MGSGGAERSTAVLCKYLIAENIGFEILCLDKKQVGVQQEMQARGYMIHFLRKGNFTVQVKLIAQFIKAGNFDLVHSILYRSNIRTRFAKVFCKFTHLESLVNTTYSEERFTDEKVNQTSLRFYKWLDRTSASWGVDHFHSITKTVKQHYIEKIKLDPQKITVIPRGRKPILETYDARPQTEKDVVHLINVGRHEFQKGQIFLLRALKIIKEKGYKVKLQILGRDGSTTSQLKQYIKENQLEEVVDLEGFKDNVPDYLVKADLFIFPSLFEGLGGALIEAQAAGLPIACNDIPVLHEVVEKDVNAKFFDVHSSASMVDAITFFLKNPEYRESYGRESFSNFNENFREAPNNKRLVALYKNLC